MVYSDDGLTFCTFVLRLTTPLNTKPQKPPLTTLFWYTQKKNTNFENLLAFDPDKMDENEKHKMMVTIETQKSVDRMVERSRWKNDVAVEINDTVILRTDFDNNRKTRKRPLLDNIDKNIYQVEKGSHNGLVNLKNLSESITLFNVCQNRLTPFETNPRILNSDILEAKKILLSKDKWLSNMCIDLYLMSLKAHKYTLYTCHEAYFIENIDFQKKILNDLKNKKGHAIVPLLVDNCHWICILLNFKKFKITYYDPLFINRDNFLKLKLKLFFPLFDLKQVFWKKQLNSHDCGVFVCAYIKFKMYKVEEEFEATALKREMAANVCNW